jgi:hypothetical protein
MAVMIHGKIPDFDQIIDALGLLEKQINQPATDRADTIP